MRGNYHKVYHKKKKKNLKKLKKNLRTTLIRKEWFNGK